MSINKIGQSLRIFRTLHWNPFDVLRRAGSLILYYLPGELMLLPRHLDLYVTYRCNLRCKMCWLWGESGTQPVTNELSLTAIKTLFDQVKKFKPIITLGGGEPLARKDIVEILEYANAYGLRCELLTNGTLITPELAQEIVRLVDHLLVSIDGPEKINDLIRGSGSFDKTVRGIKLVQEAAEKYNKKPRIRINCVVSSLNFKYLDELVDIAHTLDCHLSFQHLIYSSDEVAQKHDRVIRDQLDTDGSSIHGCVSNYYEIDINMLIEALRISRKKAVQLNVPFIVSPFLGGDENTRAWYTSLIPIPRLRCTFPWVHYFIRPNGDVTPCEFIDYHLGSVPQEDVKSILKGPKARYFRKKLRKNIFPGCVRCCKLLPWPFV